MLKEGHQEKAGAYQCSYAKRDNKNARLLNFRQAFARPTPGGQPQVDFDSDDSAFAMSLACAASPRCAGLPRPPDAERAGTDGQAVGGARQSGADAPSSDSRADADVKLHRRRALRHGPRLATSAASIPGFCLGAQIATSCLVLRALPLGRTTNKGLAQ